MLSSSPIRQASVAQTPPANESVASAAVDESPSHNESEPVSPSVDVNKEDLRQYQEMDASGGQEGLETVLEPSNETTAMQPEEGNQSFAVVEFEEGNKKDDEDEDEEEVKRPLSSKKRKSTAATPLPAKQKKQKRRSYSVKEDEEEEENGISARRRSSRTTIAPMEYWKGERVEYKMALDKETGVSVPHVEQVHSSLKKHFPLKPSNPRWKSNRFNSSSDKEDEEVQDSSASDNSSDKRHAKKSKRSKHSVKQTLTRREDSLDSEDDSTVLLNGIKQQHGTGPFNVTVKDAGTDSETTMGLVYGPKDINPQRFKPDQKFKLQKTFILEKYAGAGFIDIPVNEQKSEKNSGSTSVIFYVISGHVQATINESVIEVGKGSHFMVPRQNVYSLVNIGTKKCRVYFVQIRGPVVEEAVAVVQ
ncbi:UNVERIFIED_CONTAM: hypothetical protein HDU68_002740 [Siphonaria sp. JEL0065]|nr:hypothetical protein HDU68_002740 [Siphonaria sp. JEL0065]